MMKPLSSVNVIAVGLSFRDCAQSKLTNQKQQQLKKDKKWTQTKSQTKM